MLKLENITKKYGYKTVFDGFSLELEDNKVLCIMGASGVGKTTLLNIVAGLTDYSGSVSGDGNISYIFQNERLVPNLTAVENIEYALSSAIPDKQTRRARAEQYLRLAEIYDERDKYPKSLSGGQKQRLSAARAFAFPSKTLLMDEPFNSLDVGLKLRLMNTYADILQKSPRSVLFVTHSIGEALTLSDEILILKHNGIERLKINASRGEARNDSPEIIGLRKKLEQILINE